MLYCLDDVIIHNNITSPDVLLVFDCAIKTFPKSERVKRSRPGVEEEN